MDPETVAAYDREPARFAQDWNEQPPPEDMYERLRRFFLPGRTADVGCGSGRDAAWLQANGFATEGFDASEGLLEVARRRHPDVPFRPAVLPALEGVPRGVYRNVLCETVLMHLPVADVPAAVRSLFELLEPQGTLYISWRVSPSDGRDAQGRLYAAFDVALVRDALPPEVELLHDEESISASSGRRIHRLIVRRRP